MEELEAEDCALASGLAALCCAPPGGGAPPPLRALRTLRLGHNALLCAAPLAAALKASATLTSLDLEGNELPPCGLEDLLSAPYAGLRLESRADRVVPEPPLTRSG